MTKVSSIRVPAAVAEEMRVAARNRQTSVSALLAWILGLALADGLDPSGLPDAHEPLDGKLDVRLSEDLIRRILPICSSLRMSLSVHIRRLLYAGYTGRLAVKREGSVTR